MKYRTDCPRSTIFDLIQFVKLFDVPGVRRHFIRLNFDDLKHSWVTQDMETIWQLSVKEVEKGPDAIGNDDIAPKQFFRDMAEAIVKVNPQYEHMLKFLS